MLGSTIVVIQGLVVAHVSGCQPDEVIIDFVEDIVEYERGKQEGGGCNILGRNPSAQGWTSMCYRPCRQVFPLFLVEHVDIVLKFGDLGSKNLSAFLS